MTCKERLETHLREHGVTYKAHHHSASAFTAQEVAALEHIPGRELAKVVMAKADGQVVMLVLPSPYLVDLEKAAAVLGAEQVRLATEEEFAPYFPDCELGAMPPFGNLYGVPVYVDQLLAEDPRIFFRAGTHEDVIEVQFEDFKRLAEPVIVSFAGEPQGAN